MRASLQTPLLLVSACFAPTALGPPDQATTRVIAVRPDSDGSSEPAFAFVYEDDDRIWSLREAASSGRWLFLGDEGGQLWRTQSISTSDDSILLGGSITASCAIAAIDAAPDGSEVLRRPTAETSFGGRRWKG